MKPMLVPFQAAFLAEAIRRGDRDLMLTCLGSKLTCHADFGRRTRWSPEIYSQYRKFKKALTDVLLEELEQQGRALEAYP